MTAPEDLFVDGPVSPTVAEEVAARWHTLPRIGGTAWFHGQVRGDITGTGTVTAIEYTAYRPTADEELHRVLAEALKTGGAIDIFLRHSLGLVPAGGIAMLVGVAGAHREEVFATLARVINEVKERVPIYGKELTDNDSYRWKVNT